MTKEILASDEAFDVFDRVRKLSGHSKLGHLKQFNTARYLLAVYDPFTRYYVTKCKEGKGTNQFDALTWEVLKRLSTRELTGHEAQYVVNIHTAALTKKSALLFGMILRKNLRMGVGAKSINKIFKNLIPIHEVMLAQGFEKHRVKLPCFGSPKFDGVRGDYKQGKFYTRNGHEIVGLKHLQEEMEEIETEVDGELTIPGVNFDKGSGQIRSMSPSPNAHFHLIDLPEVDEYFTSRLLYMDDMTAGRPHVAKILHRQLNNLDEVYDFYALCRKAGYEGAVIKPFEYRYQRKRSFDWMKMKPGMEFDIKEADLLVTGIYEGKDKYAGMMGGVEVNFKDKTTRVGGGWSDAQRELYWCEPERVMGKVIEVHYMEESSKGKLRHARFVRFRDDLLEVNNES